jgi:serine/threonine protein kinase
MATVYLAHDLKHQRQVAVKVLREDLSASLGKERFQREITIAAALTHPHILTLIDSGEADGFLYYVMPYVEGPTLRQRLVREGELPVARPCASSGTWPTPWPPPTPRGWCTGTSSPRTSCSRGATPWWRTSGWPRR